MPLLQPSADSFPSFQPIRDQQVHLPPVSGAHLPVQTQSNLAGAFPSHCSAHQLASEEKAVELEVFKEQLGLDGGIIEVGEEQAAPNKHLQQR